MAEQKQNKSSPLKANSGFKRQMKVLLKMSSKAQKKYKLPLEHHHLISASLFLLRNSPIRHVRTA